MNKIFQTLHQNLPLNLLKKKCTMMILSRT